MNLERKWVSQDVEIEKAWHKSRFYIDSGHWTSHPIFASRERHWVNVEIEKIRFYGFLAKYIRHEPFYGHAKILLAPVGSGFEIKYLQGLYSEIHGIDISPEAISMCPREIITKEGDILSSGYEDEAFNVVICPLFLHHVHKVGFKPFLYEYYRILKGGGVLAIEEPSILFPLSWLAIFLRKLMGNVTGLVPDEKPVYPPSITKVLKEVGFTNIRIRGLHFNHVRFPVLLQLFSLFFDYLFRIMSPFKYFCNGIGWYCRKP